jgi:hypothetical protein
MYQLDQTEPRAALGTAAAAKYCGISVSLLRKLRIKGSDDPGIKGPRFIRLSPQLILYPIRELDAWLNDHRAT